MRSSLIVLNYNGLHLLINCLDSLLLAIGDDDEVIVVDNGSVDGSVDAVRANYPTVRVVPLDSNTFIFGLNAGLKEAQGAYVAFLNNDMTVEPDFVDKCLGYFSDSDVFAVCPRILDSEGADQGSRTSGHWVRGLIFYRCLPHVEEASDCFFAVGGQSFFRRSALVSLGSIDPLLWPMYHEDIELSYRAWKAGLRIRYAPDARCHHLGSQTSKRVLTALQLRTFVRQNELLIVWKNITDPGLLLQHAVLLLPRLAMSLVKGDIATVIGFGRAARRLPQLLRQRKHAKRQFVRSDREVLQLVSSIGEDGAPPGRPKRRDSKRLQTTDHGRIRARQKRLYDQLWATGRDEALSPDLIRFRVWEQHLRVPVADIGAGDALFSRTHQQVDTISIDISTSGLQRAANRGVAAAAEALPLRSSSLGTVLLSEVLEHAESPGAVLQEARRVLRNDGILLLSVPVWPLAYPEALYHRLRTGQRPRLENIALWDTNHERRYDRSLLIAEVRAAGFDVAEIHPIFGSATTAALYILEPLLARATGHHFRLAHRAGAVDHLIRPLDRSSGVALVCRVAQALGP